MFGIFKSVDLQPEEFAAQLKAENGTVIDCRTAGEVAGGSWPGAKHCDWLSGGFAQKVDTLDRDASYFLYCRSGNRSKAGAGLMKQMGFKKVYNVGAFGDIAHLI
jgi:phage shock protein E